MAADDTAGAPAMTGVLVETVLYSGDNGRIHCGRLECAGSSAFFSGFTTSGAKVEPLTVQDAADFRRAIGRAPECEDCGPNSRRPRATR